MDGILLINKPLNKTSRDVVNEVSRNLNIKKMGHTGTLDPLATGLLVLCIGKATKISSLITDYNKEYIAEVTLGIETDTLDLEGEIIKKEVVSNISKQQVIDALNSFMGCIKQEVPKYSAIKINGKKLYEYARANIEVKLPVREVTIDRLELISELTYRDDTVKFNIICQVSKGTYIRSLVRDIGYKLNTVACMSSLNRSKQGPYNLSNSYSLEDIRNNKFKLINIYEALSHLPMVKVSGELESKIRNGAIVERFFNNERSVIINHKNEVIAIYQTYEKDETRVKPYKMI